MGNIDVKLWEDLQKEFNNFAKAINDEDFANAITMEHNIHVLTTKIIYNSFHNK